MKNAEYKPFNSPPPPPSNQPPPPIYPPPPYYAPKKSYAQAIIGFSVAGFAAIAAVIGTIVYYDHKWCYTYWQNCHDVWTQARIGKGVAIVAVIVFIVAVIVGIAGTGGRQS